MNISELIQIESKLQYSFKNKHLLEQAFTHSSYAKASNARDNERMEFLGDAILDMVVSEYLCGKYADCEVGALSAMRANIVSAEALRPIVDNLGIMQYLQLGGGAANITAASKKIEANLYEAIVAAIYLDGGMGAAKSFILQTLNKPLSEVIRVDNKDGKTLLQEYCQKRKMPVPTYVLAERTGADNDPTYKYDLYVDGEYMCSGEGRSKKTAEQDAAKKLVTKWRIDSALS